MKVEDFDYHLPEELIAQTLLTGPLRDCSWSTGKRGTGDIFHKIIDYFVPGDVLVLNDTKSFRQDLYQNRYRSEH